MIERDLAPRLTRAARQWPSITLTGPRQSGKTTLCRSLFPQHPYETLEAPDTRAFAIEDPRAFLARFPRGAVLDEIQRAPDLLSYLQGIIDADPAPGRWILTGSQNLALLETVSQSLAGRTAIYNLLPLTRGETVRFPRHPDTLDEVLFAGSYPRIFDEGIDPDEWFRSYVAAYIERDVRTIANVGNLAAFQRFVALCAGRTAQLLNHSALAGDCGVSQPTAKAWLSILETSFLIFRLPAFHANIRKRLVKMPKLHFYDTGLVCWLLGIRSPEQLRSHPLRGPIFETWVVSEVAKQRVHRGEQGGLSFYRDRNGAEADLILQGPEGPAIVEAKSAETASSGLFAGAGRVRRGLAGESGSLPAAVVYGGDRPQRRGADRLVPWRKLSEFELTTLTDADIKRLATRPGPERSLAFYDMARRVRENPSDWAEERTMRWSPLDLTRAPNPAEIEWAFLECSRRLSSGDHDEVGQDRDARMDELDRLLTKDPDSLQTRCRAALAEEMRRQEDA